MLKITNQIDEIKNDLIDVALLAFMITFVPIIILTSMRMFKSGFTINIIIVPLFLLVVVSTYLRRNKLSLKAKMYIIICSFLLVATTGFYSYGMLSMGVSILLTLNLLVALYSNKKMVYAILSISVLIIFSFAVLFSGEYISLSFDMNDYMKTISNWGANIFGFLAFALLSSFSIRKMMSMFYETIDETNQSKQQYMTLVEGVDDLIFSFDQHGIVKSFNRNFEMLNMSKSKIIGTDILCVIGGIVSSPEVIKQWKTSIKAVLQEGKKVNFVYEFFDSQNKVISFDVILIPLLNDVGEVSLVIGNQRDITELMTSRVQIEEMLKTENVKLEQLVESRTETLEKTMKELMNQERLASLGSMVAGVAHEINTPLGVSVTASSFLTQINQKAYDALKRGEFGKKDLLNYMRKVDETSEMINSNLYRSSELVKSFKQISVSQSSDLKTRFDLKKYIQSTVLMLHHEFKRTSIEIQIEMEDSVFVTSYPSAFSQILTNLLMNSLHHGFESMDSGLITIQLSLGDALCIIYKDDGKGIEEGHMNKIYDPFFTTSRSSGGSGLGLSIIYNIIRDQLNGSIECMSEIGIGTTFIITLPRDIVHSEER